MIREVEVVCAIILNDNHEFLLCERGPNKEFSNLFEFPGGKVEENETHIEALKREIKEELLCDIDVSDYFTTIKHTYTKTPINKEITINLHAYFAKLKDKAPTLTEHKSLVWTDSKNALNLNLAYADRLIVKELIQKM